jgi:hypothetical protein
MLIQLLNEDWIKAEDVTRITAMGDEVKVWLDGAPIIVSSRKTYKEADEYKDELARIVNEATRQSHPAPHTSPQASSEPQSDQESCS